MSEMWIAISPEKWENIMIDFWNISFRHLLTLNYVRTVSQNDYELLKETKIQQEREKELCWIQFEKS